MRGEKDDQLTGLKCPTRPKYCRNECFIDWRSQSLTHLCIKWIGDKLLWAWCINRRGRRASALVHIMNRRICLSVCLSFCPTGRYLLLNGKSFWHAFFCKTLSDHLILLLFGQKSCTTCTFRQNRRNR